MIVVRLDTVVEATCMWCGTKHDVEVNERDFHNWQSGVNIQNAMPYLTDDEREILISKTCGKCYDEMFEEEDE
jgi:hypothetical protein